MVLIKLITASLGLFFLLSLSLSAETVRLTWTAVGDDGSVGRASDYDLRYNTSVITEANFYTATRISLASPPQLSGTKETVFIDGLEGGVRYYFAVKAVDEQNNWSPLSNVVSKIPCQFGCNGIRGNVDGDISDQITITDLVFLIKYLYNEPGADEPSCFDEADIDASGEVDVSDLIYLSLYMFNEGVEPEYCS